MQHSALVIVDFESADKDQRLHFDLEMAKRQWVPYPDVASSYRVDFTDADSDQAVVVRTEFDVTESAESAKIYQWHAVCVIDDAETECDVRV